MFKERKKIQEREIEVEEWKEGGSHGCEFLRRCTYCCVVFYISNLCLLLREERGGWRGGKVVTLQIKVEGERERVCVMLFSKFQG